ncbi:MAG: hypothetical protein ABW194_11525 [Novosphingobium sp.]
MMAAKRRTAKGAGGLARERARAADECRRLSADRFARLHPEKAREERDLRKRQAAVAREFGRKGDTHDGTPETRHRAKATRQGALARLYQSGALSADQLAWAGEIAAIAERIGGEAGVRTVSLETRVDGGGHGTGAFWETLGAVRREVAYTRWRGAAAVLSPHGAGPLLALIVEDAGVTIVAQRYAMGPKRLRKLLADAIDLWPGVCRDARQAIDRADVEAAKAGLI